MDMQRKKAIPGLINPGEMQLSQMNAQNNIAF
jgi:hypothetical protein